MFYLFLMLLLVSSCFIYSILMKKIGKPLEKKIKRIKKNNIKLKNLKTKTLGARNFDVTVTLN